MRFLGIDFGTKRIGLALSDENGTLAFPKEIITNDGEALARVMDFVQRENIGGIVIGESTNFSGRPNKLSSKIKIFTDELSRKIKLPIHRQKEFLTSVEARRSKDGKKDSHISPSHSRIKKKKSTEVDALAAALILQRYLDQKNR